MNGMKKIRKLISVALCLGLLSLTSICSLAAEENANTQDENVTRYIPCSSGGKHTLKSVGSGIVDDKNANIKYVARFYQCRGCGLYLGCQNIVSGSASASRPGHVAASYNLSYVGNAVYMTGDCYMDYYTSITQDDWIKGFDFGTGM